MSAQPSTPEHDGTVVPGAGAPPVIEAVEISAGYGEVPVLDQVSVQVRAGEVVALVGANGAGKSTTLMALSGELPLTHGEVRMDGQVVTGPLHARARRGLRLICEDRSVFMSLSVADNLRLAHDTLDEPLALFPELEPLLERKVGLLSGGEQQMLTLARALSGPTRLLLADELSLGLAPLIVQRLLKAVRAAADRGMAVLLVEQQVRNALAVADRACVLQRGRVVLEGTADELRSRTGEVEASYLAASAAAPVEMPDHGGVAR
ncbi:ABC transporter ATP-binding protein [Streptomyces sp. NPDC021080]|uniref:ABC transporter ATP-binding protein n=1 Tax=Streptomyces sp. NPDC021080 TaxID=3365110 RepID=UPI00379726AF